MIPCTYMYMYVNTLTCINLKKYAAQRKCAAFRGATYFYCFTCQFAHSMMSFLSECIYHG